MAGLSTLQSGPKGTKMVNLSVFDHLGPFWAHLDPFEPFQTRIDILLRSTSAKPYFVHLGQKINGWQCPFDPVITQADKVECPPKQHSTLVKDLFGENRSDGQCEEITNIKDWQKRRRRKNQKAYKDGNLLLLTVHTRL